MSDLPSNAANLSYHGSSWNAPHMDTFLQSDWGDKLFVAGKAKSRTASVRAEEGSNLNRSTVIRPSPAFLALPRNVAAVADFQTIRSSAVDRDVQPRLPPDSVSILNSMHKIEARKRELEAQAARLLPSLARKQIYEAEKKQTSDYSVLKSQRLMVLKRQRIMSNEYRSGVIGGRDGDRPRSKVLKTSANSVARVDTLVGQTRTSPDIEFHNPMSASVSPYRPRAHYHPSPDQHSHHSHDTHQSLFVPDSSPPNPTRLARLTELTRGSRSFNIVTGTQY